MIDFVIDGMIQSEREEPYPEDMKMLKVLLENGANVELEDENRERPIDIISSYAAGSPEMLNQLKRIFAPFDSQYQ